MKSANRIIHQSFAIVVVMLVASVYQVQTPFVHAQESKKKGPASQSTPSLSAVKKFAKDFDGKQYPVFNLYEVVDRLTTSMDDLIEKNQIKTSTELKKNLDRTEFSVDLPKPLAAELKPDELFLRAAESVFLVAGMTKPTKDEKAWKTAFSTAFAIHEDGILSTSAHVFDHDDADDGVVVMDKSGEVFPVLEILAANRSADTCLFRIARKGLTPLPLGSDRPPGTPIQVMGHPGDSFFFFSAGHISNYETDEEGASWLNVTADFGQGSSGGPVMDGKGNVVGQVSRTYTLYAGGEATNRRRRMTRKQTDTEPTGDKKDKADDPDEPAAPEKKSDPQMVFKSCTPASAIRALIK